MSVIVVHFRQQAELDRTLAALHRQTHPADRTEIIVVDDGSPEPPTVPDTVRLLRQADEGFRLAAARQPRRVGSHRRVLCFLDADTTPEPDYLTRMALLPALAPQTVVAGRRRHAALAALPVNAPVEHACPANELPEPQWLFDAYRQTRDLLDADYRSYRYVIGAAFACSRWFFDRVGTFDERFRAYGGEDWEWVYRAWLGGAILAHDADAVAWHDGPDWRAARRRPGAAGAQGRRDAAAGRSHPGRRSRATACAATTRTSRSGSARPLHRRGVRVCRFAAVRPARGRGAVPVEFAGLFVADQRSAPRTGSIR